MEYDIALDHQIEWASFWTSDYGLALHQSLYRAISKKRAERGELDPEAIVDASHGEYVVELMPLLNGDCFYWSPQMLDLVSLASHSLPDNWFLMKQHIPAIAGFFWFAKELIEHPGTRAFGWTVATVRDNTAAIYVPREDNSIPDFNAVALITFVDNPEFPKPIPCRTRMHIEENLSEWKLKQSDYAVSINADPSDFTRDYSSVRLFATMLSFIQQKILVPSRYGVSRPTRRRAESAKRQAEPEIKVIRLRQVVHHAHEGDGVPVEWSCRWIVRGHWRDQWYPSLRRNQPLWIRPYLKGPEDKPLHNPNKLFAVVR